uniref:Cuticle protein 19-like n=1 Tax=Diabrotica virgifera virgifera TaxID=50390 RepID=A0A6P7G750_DIAVI
MFVKVAVMAVACAMCSAGYVDISPYHEATAYGKLVRSPIYETPYYGGEYDGYGDGYGYEKDYDHHDYPKYEFAYGVNDPHTGDHKSQHEERDGDVVKGYYTVADPDGTLRTVHYTADDHNGFNAIVEKDGHSIYPQPVVEKVYVEPVVEKVVLEPVYEKAIYEKPIYEKPFYGYENGPIGDKYGFGY